MTHQLNLQPNSMRQLAFDQRSERTNYLAQHDIAPDTVVERSRKAAWHSDVLPFTRMPGPGGPSRSSTVTFDRPLECQNLNTLEELPCLRRTLQSSSFWEELYGAPHGLDLTSLEGASYLPGAIRLVLSHYSAAAHQQTIIAQLSRCPWYVQPGYEGVGGLLQVGADRLA